MNRSPLSRALSAAALCAAGLVTAAACGPLSAPLPQRLAPERQREVDDAWGRALSPVTKYDRGTWLDVLIVRQPYQVGVDKFEFKSEKRFSGGVVEMESRFDRSKPDEDLFQVTVKDPQGNVVRQERYTRPEIERAREELAHDNTTPQKERWKRIDEVFPKELLRDKGIDAGTDAGGPQRLSVAGGASCSNGSALDCNVAGTTLRAGSAYVDPAPPSGWTQCAGFINTPGDDVAARFLDHCLDTNKLRVRVFTSDNELEEDVTATDMTVQGAWPNFNYLGGTVVVSKKTHWGTTTFFTTTDGKDACAKQTAPPGTTFGAGDANVAIVAGSNKGDDEYRVSCGGASLPYRKIALYR